jgi:hypothetical protein
MKWWKSVNEAKLEGHIARLMDRVVRAEDERDYWKAKAERLLDMALFKREEIRAPVFQETKKSADVSPMLKVLGAMQTHEIDSAKQTSTRPLASTAAPVTPMT